MKDGDVGENVNDDDHHQSHSPDDPNSQGRVLIFGINAAEDYMAIYTFAHLFAAKCNVRFHNGIPSSFVQAMNRISAPEGRDIVYVWRLTSYLSKIIAGDYFNDMQLGSVGSVFDIMEEFPLEVIEKVSFDIEEGAEDAGRTQMKELESEHEKGIEQGEVYLVSVNVLRFWMENTKAVDKPLSTYWKFWAKDVSKQMLGEAIGFKLCIMHSMTCKAFEKDGRTDKKSLQGFIKSL